MIERIAGGNPAVQRRLDVTFDGPDRYRVVEETAPADAETRIPGIVTMTRRTAPAP